MDILKIIQALVGRMPFLGGYCCNICKNKVGRFIPYKNNKNSLLTLPKVLDVIGSDTVNFECPWCGAHDRERHLFMYMQTTGFFDNLSSMRVLHFAPERRLAKLITAEKPIQYIKCDLHPNMPDIQPVDMLAIPYPDKYFNLVIANHVLEHVADDILALKEIYRILKPGGHVILQTPFSPLLHTTWSDNGVITDQARLIAYGQADHVRLFGRDILDRFSSTGLTSKVQQHKDLLSINDSKQYGVNTAEPFFLFTRNEV